MLRCNHCGGLANSVRSLSLVPLGNPASAAFAAVLATDEVAISIYCRRWCGLALLYSEMGFCLIRQIDEIDAVHAAWRIAPKCRKDVP